MQISVIKIDVYTRTIYPVSIDAGQLQDLYTAIGCTTIDFVARRGNGDALCVDDEALLKEPQAPCFKLSGYHSPICGNALVIGSDEDGNSREPATSIIEIQKRVSFTDPLNIEPTIQIIFL